MGNAVLSALFVMLVVFCALVVLYVLVKVFTAVVRGVETKFLSGGDGKEGGA
jgi:hypothetical protein